MTSGERTALVVVAIVGYVGYRKRRAIRAEIKKRLQLFADDEEPKPAIDRSPPLPGSPTATIVDATDGQHYHLVADATGTLLGVFDTIGTAASTGRALGYVVSR